MADKNFEVIITKFVNLPKCETETEYFRTEGEAYTYAYEKMKNETCTAIVRRV